MTKKDYRTWWRKKLENPKEQYLANIAVGVCFAINLDNTNSDADFYDMTDCVAEQIWAEREGLA